MPKSSDPSVHVKVEPDFLLKLKKLCQKEKRTMANLCLILLEEAMKRRENGRIDIP